MNTIKTVFLALSGVLSSFFTSDMDVMSSEAKRIFANEEDKQKYIEAVERLKKSESQRETIRLSNNEEITLVS